MRGEVGWHGDVQKAGRRWDSHSVMARPALGLVVPAGRWKAVACARPGDAGCGPKLCEVYSSGKPGAGRTGPVDSRAKDDGTAGPGDGERRAKSGEGRAED